MKGKSSFFIGLSVLGILVGVFLAWQGASGQSLGPSLLLAIGVFVIIKEILDIIV